MSLSKTLHWAATVSLVLSIALGVFLSLCFSLRADWCAAVTYLPPWLWVAPGIILAVVGWSRNRKRHVGIIILLWLTYLLTFADEPWGMARAVLGHRLIQSDLAESETIRVVSLNCALMNVQAMFEVADHNPDVVLLQEAPSESEVQKLAQRLFGDDGGFLYGYGKSVIGRGKVEESGASTESPIHFLSARVDLGEGRVVEAVSVHLWPPSTRTDLWNRRCWIERAEWHKLQRKQLEAVARRIEPIPRTMPLIVGGDFNAPAGDDIFRFLQSRLHDSFKEAGIGWGNTFINDLPVLCIDQVWVSDHFRPLRVRAVKTKHSDHRMVICDLAIQAEPADRRHHATSQDGQ